MNIISHNKPWIDEKEIQAVTRVLESNWLIRGELTKAFEKDFAAYIGSRYAIAVTSGTAALHVSLVALQITTGDEVILPTYTAADILNAIFYVGAKPVLIDIEKNACTISLSAIEKHITKKTKALIIPHTFGFPIDVEKIKQYGIPLIEDCAQTLGSTYHNHVVGAKSLISIFSFYASKLITTGQGGMITTDREDLYRDIKDLIDYNGRDNYRVRYNYPLTDIAASIGLTQLKKFPFFTQRRKWIAQQYWKVLEKKGVTHFPTRKDTHIVPFRFLIQCNDPRAIQKKYLEQGIETKPPIAPYELLHRLLNQDKKKFPNAELFADSVLSLPLYPGLKDEEVEQICNAMEKIL